MASDLDNCGAATSLEELKDSVSLKIPPSLRQPLAPFGYPYTVLMKATIDTCTLQLDHQFSIGLVCLYP